MSNTTLQVANANQLKSAISSATGGETIVLADGYYGALSISKDFASKITIKAANEGGAKFGTVDLSQASNVTISGVQMASGKATQNAANITFEDSVSTGGMYFRDVKGLTLEGNDISGGEHTLILNDIQNFVVRSNEIHHAQSDLVRVTGASKFGLFENNFIHDVAAKVPQHPDLIQLIGLNGVNPTDITFTGNVLYDDPKTGDIYGQGLFISEPIGSGYKNILIENNMIMVGSPNSIYINGGQENIVIQNNTLLPWPGANGGVIRLTDKNGYDNSGVTVTDNVARLLMDETGGSSIGQNFFYSSSEPAFLRTLFQGLDGSWQGFLPVKGSTIDFGSGMGALERMTELLNGKDGPSAAVPAPLPTPPATAPAQPSQPVPEDGDYTIGDGTTVFSMDTVLRVSGRAEVLEVDLGQAGKVASGNIAFNFNADKVNGQFGLVSRDASGNGDHFTSYIKDGALVVRFQNASSEVYLTAKNIVAGTAYGVAISFGADGIDLSVNGKVVDSSSFGASMVTNTEMLQIGANGWASSSGAAGFTQVFAGTIWDVAITDNDGSGFSKVLASASHANSNWLSSALGADVLLGGSSSDTVSYANSVGFVNVSLASGYAGGGSGSHATGDSFVSIENLAGSAFNDLLGGDEGSNILFGMAGTDLLQGRGGDDVLFGGAGGDTVDGGAGSDTASYSDSAGFVNVSLTSGYAGGGSGSHAIGDIFISIENIAGSAFNDLLSGDAGANILYGAAGDDHLQGRGDNDLILGGTGSDILNGGTGNDTASYSDSAGFVNVSLASGYAGGGAGSHAIGDTFLSIENLTGSAFNDLLSGDAKANILIGGAGDDLLRGRAGGDALFGGAGSDTASYSDSAGFVNVSLASGYAGGGAGSHAIGDTFDSIENLVGSAFNDLLSGDAAANTLSGAGGNDILRGNDGDDVLNGGFGDDLLTGGRGADMFVFAERGGWDRVADFEDGTDLLNITYSGGSYGSLTINQVGEDLTVWYGSGGIVLENTLVSQISAEDFVFG